ncbi:hypothetical protein BEN60_gp045 [Gordonia phage Smoothie]|uniref:Uncharacterized protein n=1 Tax=Gordonia phage Smoothie TaxID=1838078 RepID=A0A166Y8P2_9CAUD|nr:hypothetical protein BEN60_gp045 [Gordonia phage Smoothie]ANA86317.1 hypothetical protein PBI_SMOOTHIE_162 [Gordonia phage Smoothie]
MSDKSIWRMEIELVYIEEGDSYAYKIRGLGPRSELVTDMVIDEGTSMASIEDALMDAGVLQ